MTFCNPSLPLKILSKETGFLIVTFAPNYIEFNENQFQMEGHFLLVGLLNTSDMCPQTSNFPTHIIYDKLFQKWLLYITNNLMMHYHSLTLSSYNPNCPKTKCDVIIDIVSFS